MIGDGERLHMYVGDKDLNNDVNDINNLNEFIRHNLFSLSFYENRKSSTELFRHLQLDKFRSIFPSAP